MSEKARARVQGRVVDGEWRERDPIGGVISHGRRGRWVSFVG